MNKKMKKIIATIVLAGGVFSQFPVAFCSDSSEEIDLLIESILKADDKEANKTLDVNSSKMPAKTLAVKKEESLDGKNNSRIPVRKDIIEKEQNFSPADARRRYSFFRNVIIPDGVKKISAAAFRNFNSLERITLPKGVESIGEYAFAGCKKLKRINLPNSLEMIQEFAFKNCESLEFIYIPESVHFLGSSAFDGCDRLRCIRYGNKKYYNYRKFCEDFYRKNG